METLFSIVLASFVVSLISLTGGFLLFWSKLWQRSLSQYLVSFGAGVLLATAFLDLMPEALEMSIDEAGIFVPIFLGIVVFFFLERFVLWFHHHDDLHNTNPPAVLILLGDSLHNFIDGLAIAATFLTNPILGVSTTLAIAAHEVPQELADLSILIAGGMKKAQALFYNFLSALTSLIGGIVGFYFLDKTQELVPLFLSFTAGMFIYIACSDLIPELHKDFKSQKSWANSIPFIVGILVSWLFVKVLEG